MLLDNDIFIGLTFHYKDLYSRHKANHYIFLPFYNSLCHELILVIPLNLIIPHYFQNFLSSTIAL